jgi:hypothetical protein
MYRQYFLFLILVDAIFELHCNYINVSSETHIKEMPNKVHCTIISDRSKEQTIHRTVGLCI